jgi:hypothetical protein
LRQSHTIAGQLWRFTLVLTAFLLLDGIGFVQTSTPVFWELRPEKVDAMLLGAPNNDKDRYARLREYFSDLHCTDSAMEEAVIPKHEKNLICTLPGKDSEQIVVAARYEHRGTWNGMDRGWNEAVTLALLYNGLKAELRQHTFVFAGLCGRAGQDAFLESIRKRRRPAPKVLVVLDALGFGNPWFYALPEFPITAKGRQRSAMKKSLESEAAATAQVEKIPTPMSGVPMTAADNTLLSDADQLPAIVLYSAFNQIVPPKAFHQNFEFVAYYLCRIDLRLSNRIPY